MSDKPWEVKDLRLLFTSKVKGNEAIHINCLWHAEDTPSCAVYPDHAYCFGCGKWASYFDVVDQAGKEPPERTENEDNILVPTKVELLELANTYHKRLFLAGMYNQQQYFTKRGLTESTIKRYLLGYSGHAFVIPIWAGTEIQTIRFRRDDSLPNPPKSKYWGTKGLNGPMIYAPEGLEESMLWCEGEFDTLIGLQCGSTAMTVTNGVGIDKSWVIPQLLDNGVKFISLCFDRDTASFGKTLELTGQLLDAGLSVKVVKLPYSCKDLNEAYLRYGDKIVELL